MGSDSEFSIEEFKQKAERYCAYQDRSRKEVRMRLLRWKCPASAIDQILDDLEDSKFIDEVRFAESYVRGKFKMKQWGKMKIRAGLLSKGIPDALVNASLEKLEEEAYEEACLSLLERYKARNEDVEPYQFRQKAHRYLSGKGYSSDLIIRCLNRLKSNPT